MLITRHNKLNNPEVRDIAVTKQELDRWKNGEMASEVFCCLSHKDYEFLVNNVTSDKYDILFE